MLLTLCLQASAQHVTKAAAQAKAVEFFNQQRDYPTRKVGAVLLLGDEVRVVEKTFVDGPHVDDNQQGKDSYHPS